MIRLMRRRNRLMLCLETIKLTLGAYFREPQTTTNKYNQSWLLSIINNLCLTTDFCLITIVATIVYHDCVLRLIIIKHGCCLPMVVV